MRTLDSGTNQDEKRLWGGGCGQDAFELSARLQEMAIGSPHGNLRAERFGNVIPSG